MRVETATFTHEKLLYFHIYSSNVYIFEECFLITTFPLFGANMWRKHIYD
jgi:hypothetical protein